MRLTFKQVKQLWIKDDAIQTLGPPLVDPRRKSSVANDLNTHNKSSQQGWYI